MFGRTVTIYFARLDSSFRIMRPVREENPLCGQSLAVLVAPSVPEHYSVSFSFIHRSGERMNSMLNAC